MSKAKRSGLGRGGCGLIALLAIAGVLGLGMWAGQRKDESRTPCERYASAVYTALDNCHSGVNRDQVHHRERCPLSAAEARWQRCVDGDTEDDRADCERVVEETDECLDEIRRLSHRQCRELERRVQSYLLCRE